MYVLGVSALYHDAAAVLIKDGEIVAAAQEERFSRQKLDPSLPVRAIEYCLQEGGDLQGSDLEAEVFYDDPLLSMQRFLFNLAAVKDDRKDLITYSSDSVFSQKLWIEKSLRNHLGRLGREDILFTSLHHLSHAASAFYPSPFDEAAILTLDGVEEWNTTTIGFGKDNQISLLKQLDYPHSLGLLYSAFTFFCGFRVNFGDYKLMGLAPYGEPVYSERIKENLIDIKPDGSFRLNLSYFDFPFGRAMTNDAFAELFDGPRRMPEETITKREMDLAASIQQVTEEVIMRLAQTAKSITNSDNLVMAGGVALNCVANGRLRRSGLYKHMWIQPAAGDAGGALGAALSCYYLKKGMPRSIQLPDSQKGSLLGPSFSPETIREWMGRKGVAYHAYSDKKELFDKIAELLDEQKVIGIFSGRMEYGPRALGARSIIADSRSETMQTHLNLSIKYRESFRPFAPAVLAECATDYFEIEEESPYMLFCTDVKHRLDEGFSVKEQLNKDQNMLSLIGRKRSDIPAVTHVDYSARVQTVDEKRNPFFYGILKAFQERTGCGVLINTSFNVRGEPIVCTPEDAYRCFMNTDIDVLLLEDCILFKSEQPEERRRHDKYELD